MRSAFLCLLLGVCAVAEGRAQDPEIAPAVLEVSAASETGTPAQQVTAVVGDAPDLSLADVTYGDPDVVIAATLFAALDPRYQTLAPESYYGARLEAVQKRVTAEGMTPASKAELLAVYQGATAALAVFLTAQPR